MLRMWLAAVMLYISLKYRRYVYSLEHLPAHFFVEQILFLHYYLFSNSTSLWCVSDKDADECKTKYKDPRFCRSIIATIIPSDTISPSPMHAMWNSVICSRVEQYECGMDNYFLPFQLVTNMFLSNETYDGISCIEPDKLFTMLSRSLNLSLKTIWVALLIPPSKCFCHSQSEVLQFQTLSRMDYRSKFQPFSL